MMGGTWELARRCWKTLDRLIEVEGMKPGGHAMGTMSHGNGSELGKRKRENDYEEARDEGLREQSRPHPHRHLPQQQQPRGQQVHQIQTTSAQQPSQTQTHSQMPSFPPTFQTASSSTSALMSSSSSGKSTAISSQANYSSGPSNTAQWTHNVPDSSDTPTSYLFQSSYYSQPQPQDYTSPYPVNDMVDPDNSFSSEWFSDVLDGEGFDVTGGFLGNGMAMGLELEGFGLGAGIGASSTSGWDQWGESFFRR
jgi:hypothetical protein